MYLKWQEKAITDFSEKMIESSYASGFVFTRVGKGIMNQTRSIRIDLNQFELSSENRRVLKKVEDLELLSSPIPYSDYEWSIHKMGKDFYKKKFGEKTFSAQKIKELITDKEKSNFNLLLRYVIMSERDPSVVSLPQDDNQPVGYCICLETKNILHYCYPFYNLEKANSNLGMGMMLKAILWAKENGKQYIYLGSAQRPSDIYKLQFAGLEWFDGKQWSFDLKSLKSVIQN